MSTPTPDEITAHVEALLRVPHVRSYTTLGEIRAENTPFWWMVRDVLGQLDSDRLPELGELASILSGAAARHGLRITTDPEPGELIQYRLVRRAANGWFLHDPSVSYESSQGGLDAAESDRAKYADPEGCCPRIVVVRLLPEGGKA